MFRLVTLGSDLEVGVSLSSPIEQALRPIVDALQADGYTALITEFPGAVTFEITAGAQACEDCLSPRPVLEPLITQVLRRAGITDALNLKYPVEH